MNKSYFKLNREVIKKVLQVTVIILLIITMTKIADYVIGVFSSGTDIISDSEAVLSKVGSRGDEVRRIQTKLKQLGYYKGNVDGIYGTNTKNAIQK